MSSVLLVVVTLHVNIAPFNPSDVRSGDKTKELESIAVSIGSPSKPTKNHCILVAFPSPTHVHIMSRARPTIKGVSCPVISICPINK